MRRVLYSRMATLSLGATVTASVRPQADGTTRVAFDISGEGDSNLSQRVRASYNARMGR